MARDRSSERVRKLLPLKPADFHILLSLSEEDLHGYGLMKAVEHQSDGSVRLELGSLYRQIARLVDAGLIAAAADDEADRRRVYRITSLGRQVLQAEARRLAHLVDGLRARRILKSPLEA